MQCAEFAALLGDHQATRGVAVQAVDQFQEMCLRAFGAQRLDHAETETAAAMNGHTGRFVDHQQPAVFVQDAAGKTRPGGIRNVGRVAHRHAQRRQPQFVAGAQPIVRLRPAPVHPNLTLTQYTVYAAPGDALEVAQQEIVDSLAGLIVGDFESLHSRFVCVAHVRILAAEFPRHPDFFPRLIPSDQGAATGVSN